MKQTLTTGHGGATEPQKASTTDCEETFAHGARWANVSPADEIQRQTFLSGHQSAWMLNHAAPTWNVQGAPPWSGQAVDLHNPFKRDLSANVAPKESGLRTQLSCGFPAQNFSKVAPGQPRDMIPGQKHRINPQIAQMPSLPQPYKHAVLMSKVRP